MTITLPPWPVHAWDGADFIRLWCDCAPCYRLMLARLGGRKR